jgi:tetratricopeptide (TPR) repeat protein
MRPFLFGFLAAVALLAAAFLVWQHGTQTSNVSSTTDSLATLVAEESAKLAIKPHTVVLTTDKAMSAADALRHGDYQSAEVTAEAVKAQSRLESFAFYPFNDFISHLSQGDDPKFLEGLDAWIAHSPKSAMPYLIRARYYYDTAWLIRGSDFNRAVPEEHARGFREFLDRADADIRQSIELDSAFAYSHYLRLSISAVHDNFQRVDQVFLDGIARFPGYYPLYRTRLNYLQPKWGGSTSAMYQFVDRYAAKAPDTSPLKLLYLELTRDLLNAASVDCNELKNEALSACVDAQMNRYVSSNLTEGVTKALGLYKYSDPIQYSNALLPILADMVGTEGDSASVNTVLQLAADAMGSDNQLIHEPGHNNYVLDDMTARIWFKLGNPANVEQKFNEALNDVARLSFPNEEKKDIALGAIYDEMAWIARSSRQYAKVIAYYDAANAVAGENHGDAQYLKCFAYLKLNHFQEAVEECTRLIDAHRDVPNALYDRAQAFEGLKNYDAALADFAPIADHGSDNYVRWGAVIEMGHIDALLGKIAASLDLMNKYPFIFDADIQPPDDLAVAYNNRCFCYMKLGELKKAMDDCTTSLKYGRLPDALQKQQQLQKMLAGQTT